MGKERGTQIEDRARSGRAPQAAARSLGFILRVMGTHCRGSSRGIKGSNLHFKKIILTTCEVNLVRKTGLTDTEN